MPFELERNDRMLIYRSGGFTGGLFGDPVDITLDRLQQDDFNRAAALFMEIQKPSCVSDEMANSVSECGYVVEVGSHGDRYGQLRLVFNGNLRVEPAAVAELDGLLKKYAKPEDLRLKP